MSPPSFTPSAHPAAAQGAGDAQLRSADAPVESSGKRARAAADAPPVRPRPVTDDAVDHVLVFAAGSSQADRAKLAARKRRFETPVDAAAALNSVRRARRAFSGNMVWTRAGGSTSRNKSFEWARPRALNLFSGRSRAGDIEDHRRRRGGSCLSIDLKGAAPYDVDAPGNADALITRAHAGEFDDMHASWDCATWSAALSLPPGGRAPGAQPLGPYRGAHAPRGFNWVQGAHRRRLEAADNHMMLAITLGKVLHDQGKSVTLENAPDCSKRDTPWFIQREGYTSATQFAVWHDPAMREYIAYTGSVVVVRPMCAAGSPYRNYKALCMNPAAARHAGGWLGLVCRHQAHTPMSGKAPNGRYHGAIAEEYTPQCALIFEEIGAGAAAERGVTPTSSPDAGGGGGDGGGSNEDGGGGANAGGAPDGTGFAKDGDESGARDDTVGDEGDASDLQSPTEGGMTETDQEASALDSTRDEVALRGQLVSRPPPSETIA